MKRENQRRTETIKINTIWILFEDAVFDIVISFSPQIYFKKMNFHYILNIGLFVKYYANNVFKSVYYNRKIYRYFLFFDSWKGFAVEL
jgi:hypothetical protein